MKADLRNITIRQLRALAAVASSRRVTTASNQLGLTQPAVTQQLRQLQDLANLPLIQRTGAGMILTDAGYEVLELSKRIEAAIKACQESLNMMIGHTGGSVSIGVVSTAKYFAPNAIAAFLQRFPKIGIKLTIGNREEMRNDIRGYDLDFAIMGRPPEDVDVEAHLIGDHPHVIIAPSNHHLAKNSNLTISDLAHETFLMRERGSGTRTLMETLFASADVQPQIGMEMSSNETIKQAVIAGLGIAFISSHTVATELEDGRLTMLEVAGLPIVRQWFIVRRRDKVLLPPARALLDFLGAEGARFLPTLPK